MTKITRWGILGASKFAREQMAPAIHLAENAVLAAVATRSVEKAQPFQALAPGLQVFTDYDAMLAAPDIDAIYIPLPNHLHVEWTKKALAAGKPVLCEKPIALAAEAFDDLIAARDASGVLAAEAYMIVHHPQWQYTRELVQSGAIGEVRHVQGSFCYNNAAATGNIRNRPETGGGGLPDIGVYPFGAARFVMGEEPQDVTADITWENGVDTIARVAASFPSFGFQALISMRLGLYQHMSFHGSDGVIRLSAPFNAGGFGEASVELRTSEGEQIRRFTAANQYVLQVEAFGRALHEGADYPVTLEFSRGTQVMIDMAYAAAGRP